MKKSTHTHTHSHTLHSHTHRARDQRSEMMRCQTAAANRSKMKVREAAASSHRHNCAHAIAATTMRCHDLLHLNCCCLLPLAPSVTVIVATCFASTTTITKFSMVFDYIVLNN